MAADVLCSPQAIDASVLVVRTFIQLRRSLETSCEGAGRLAAVEKRLVEQDTKIASIIEVLRQLTNPSIRARRRIGFGPFDSKMES
jgi:hypothetical protein